MADRIPLIVNPSAEQIQELPNQDDLVLSGQLKLTGTALGSSDILMSGGSDAKSVITIRGTASNLSQLNIACRNNADNADVPVAEFNVGASNKIEFVSKGEITAVQPTCLLTVPVTTSIAKADAEKPISFTNTNTNVNCSTSLATNATENSGITSISVPSAGTYLVSACVSGTRTGGTATDQIIFGLSKSGITTFPTYRMYPTFVFGNTDSQEYNCSFTVPLTLSANDNLCVHLSHIDESTASITDGYFSVTKLH